MEMLSVKCDKHGYYQDPQGCPFCREQNSKRIEWVVFRENQVVCLRCSAAETTPKLPISVERWCETMSAFIDRHRECRERVAINVLLIMKEWSCAEVLVGPAVEQDEDRLSRGDFHGGSTFQAQIFLTESQAAELIEASKEHFEPVVFLVFRDSKANYL